MGLILITAQVKLMSEDDFEMLEEHERRGTEPSSAKWKWRQIGMHTDDIRRVIGYVKGKCIILDYNGEYLLVNEPFTDVYKKWDENKEQQVEFVPDFEAEEAEIEEDDE